MSSPETTQTFLRDGLRTAVRFLQLFTALLAPVILILLWEALVRGDVRIGNFVLFEFTPVLDPVFFARPSEIVPALEKLYEDGILADAVWTSTVRVLYGFVLGALPAVVLGILMGSTPLLYSLFQPLAEALYATPKIAFLPLVLFIYGAGEEGLVNIIAFSVFFLVLLGVVKSVRQVDLKYREIARSFGARPIAVFFSVTLPASMPGIMTGLQLGLGFALVVIVGAEFLAADSGIGWQIWRAKENFDVVNYFAGLVTVATLGYILAAFLGRIGELFLPWLPRPARPQPTYIQRRLNVYWMAVRPWSFVATVVPLLLGSVIAGYDRATRFYTEFTILSLRPKISIDAFEWTFDWGVFALALIGAIAFQAGTNLVNDYYDYRKGADNPQSLGIGGVIQRGELPPWMVLSYGLFCFAVGAAIGLYLVGVTDYFILYLGLFSLLAGFFYTAGPFALAYMGLGELTVAVFMGPVIVIGAYYIQIQRVTLEPLLAALPISLLVAAILHANNLRDLENDRQVGKRTLATVLGIKLAKIEYYVLVGGAYFVLTGLVLSGVAPLYTLIVLITLPSAAALMYRVAGNTEPAALNPVLRRTAQLHMRFGLLMAAGWFFAVIEAAYSASAQP